MSQAEGAAGIKAVRGNSWTRGPTEAETTECGRIVGPIPHPPAVLLYIHILAAASWWQEHISSLF